MRLYLELLRVPLLRALLASSTLARMPIAINSLAVVLMVEQTTDSYALAGACSGGVAAGTAVGGPLTARLIDRFGRRHLLTLAIAAATSTLALIVATKEGSPALVLIAIAFLVGVTFPPAASVLRGEYPTLLADRPQLLQTAYALDTVTFEATFTLAPVMVAALTYFAQPSIALIISSAALVIGCAWMLTALQPEPEPERAAAKASASVGFVGPLGVPGIRTLVLTMLPVGFAFGAIEVALPAFTDAHGSPELAGVLLALWAGGSLVGGVIYGARARRASLTRSHLVVSCVFPITLVPIAFAISPVMMAILVIPAGVMIAPVITTRNELIGMLAPVGTLVEAYTWPVTAVVSGVAIGAAVSGWLAEASSWKAGVLFAVTAATIGAGLAWQRRATITPL